MCFAATLRQPSARITSLLLESMECWISQPESRGFLFNNKKIGEISGAILFVVLGRNNVLADALRR